MTFLRVAYIAVWVIQGSYLAILVRRYSRVRREMDELEGK
jgi:CcmD family protein